MELEQKSDECLKTDTSASISSSNTSLITASQGNALLSIPRSDDVQSSKLPGMNIKKLPERLQCLRDETYPKLTVQMFFEFMRTAYQVNDSSEELATTLAANSEIDWIKLAKTDLNSQTTIEQDDELANVPKQNLCINSREDKSIGTEEMKILEIDRSCCDDDAQSFIHNTSNIENSISQNLESSLTSVMHTKARRENTKRHNFQKPGSSSLPLDQPLLSSKQNEPTNNIEEISFNGRDEAPSESLKCQNMTSKMHSVIKKTKISTAETVAEHKEQLLAKIMKTKLSDILHEGLFDSILPYIIPKPAFSQPAIKKSIVNNIDVKKSASLSNLESKTGSASKERDKERSKQRRKSLENEVEIHVCDEAKNIKKDFRCPKKLLVQKICYFADVTAGQKLEEMDISVHCDIVIFDWLMRWVKKDIIKKSEWPVLETSNVIPIMVSASFLQMEPLLENCLSYCHDNMSEVLKTSAVLTCLNDNLLTRLASLFTNVEVETLKDKKDKIQSRLFCKLIISLVDPTPDNKRGHYSSLATLFKCGKCGKIVIQSISDSVPCIPSAMKLDSKGELHSVHTRDLTWTLNDYIVTLRTDLRSWCKVYWRLWGDCHFLFCRQCRTYFPIHQMDWCCYHPENPQFFTNEYQRSSPLPLGRYPCCSQRAYRFESLPNREGCRFKEHLPVATLEKDINILNIFVAHRDVIALDPPQLFFPEKITRLVARDPALQPGKLACKESMWWDGIEIVPPRPKLGLLGKIWGGLGLRQSCQLPDWLKPSRKLRRQASQVTEISSPGSSALDSDEDDGATECGDSSANEDSYNSEESHAWPPLKQISKFRKKSRYYAAKRSDGGRSWSANLTVRYNQDNQRDFEERAALQMIMLLTKRTSAECGLLSKPYTHSKQHGHTWNYIQPLGGTYVKLEAEFREQLAQSYKSKNSSQSKGSARVKSSKIS